MFSEILTPYRAGILVFIAVLGLILWKDRENIEFHSVIFIRRTKRGIDLIKRTAQKFPRFWTGWSTTGVAVSVMVSVAGFLFLAYQVLKALMTAKAMPAVGLVLPTLSKTPSMSPGMFFIPFWYWIIGVGTVAAVHELMHGVIGVNEGFNIKSVGWFVLLIIPGAFVEPEGEEMLPEEGRESSGDESDGSNPWGDGPVLSKLRVLAAGSWSNLCVAALLLAVFFTVTTPSPGYRELKGAYEHQGVRVARVVNGSPASSQGFSEGMVIQRMGDKDVVDVKDFSEAASKFRPGESVLISGKTNSTDFRVNATVGMRNLTVPDYSPSVLERAAINIEDTIPGTYTRYIRVQEALTGSSTKEKIARWHWVKNRSEELSETAEQNIKSLESSRKPESFLGISVLPEREPKEGYRRVDFLISPLMNLMLFLIMIHSGVGFANLLPIKPLDGGWMVEEIIDEYRPGWKNLAKYISRATVTLFVLSLAVPILL